MDEKKILVYRSARVDEEENYTYWLEIVNPDTGTGTGQFITITTNRGTYIPIGHPLIIDMNPDSK
jgi:hypothetical protein